MLQLCSSGCDSTLVALSPPLRLRRWTMAARLLPLPPAVSAAGLSRRGAPAAAALTAALAVGLSDNSVQIYALDFSEATGAGPLQVSANNTRRNSVEIHDLSQT